MVNFKSTDVFRQLYYMLENPEFKQREMARALEIPHGYKISSLVTWLEKNGYVSKTYDLSRKGKTYEVIAPMALIKFYSNFRKMDEIKIAEFEIGESHADVIKYLSKEGAIFCLTTALGIYDKYFRDPNVYAYLDESKLINVSKQPRGKIKVIVYELDLKDKIFVDKNIQFTSAIRTLIDLFCDNKAHAADNLIKKMWNDEQGSI